MEKEKDAFYVLRKGDIVGIYRSLTDCQAQTGSSVCDPPVTVYKGYNLPKEAEEYLVSHGLRNPMFAISADDVRDDLFGQLVACPFQEPVSSEKKLSDKNLPQKKLKAMLGSESVNVNNSGSPSTNSNSKHVKSGNFVEARADSPSCNSCTLYFDGASKGNPGLAGAGAILHSDDGTLTFRLREGVGIATSNVAEYRALILGLKYALKIGCKHIQIRGDSNLVCMQVQGSWKTKNQNMADFCKEVQQLKNRFLSFHIGHIERTWNSDADAEANRAVKLRAGEVEEEFVKRDPVLF